MTGFYPKMKIISNYPLWFPRDIRGLPQSSLARRKYNLQPARTEGHRRNHSKQLRSNNLLGVLFAVACLVSLVSQSYATGGVNTSLSTAQSNCSLCFICKGERCHDVKKIFNSMRDDKLWMQSTAMSALGCSLTSCPSSGKCVPCVDDRNIYIVCLDMPKDLKLDLEDGDGNSFSNTEATCPRLKEAGPVGQAGHNSGVRGLAGHRGEMIAIGIAAAFIFVIVA